MTVAGSTVYLGGWFWKVGGQLRHSVAAVDATTGALRSWNPNGTLTGFLPNVEDIAVSGSTVYVGGTFDAFGGQPRESLAAVDATSGQVKPFTVDFVGEHGLFADVRAVAVAPGNGVVYVGGRFIDIEATGHSYLAGISP